jgi:hypothetical protein
MEMKIHAMLSSVFMANVDPRRKQEMADARMIREDPTAMANCPTRFIHREFDSGKFVPQYHMENEIGME